jgi:LemA protein
VIFAWIVIVVFVLAVVLGFIGIYNALVRLRNRVKNAWAQIDVQLKRRYDLIPNLMETVKGYMKHERETLEAVTKARQIAIAASGGVADQAKAENMLTQTLRSLFAVVENYPDLKANQNFLALQEELTSTENKIGFARQFYNDEVLRLNNKVEMFPSNLVAGMFTFKQAESFELEDEAQREAPKVEF